MDKRKSQHYNFCYEAMPALFHVQTKDFMKYIERDGVKFLEFWWKHIGNQLPFEKLTPFTNFSLEKSEISKDLKVFFLTLPPPQEDGEMYFMALVARPVRHFAWVRLPSTRILALVRRSREKFQSGTEFGDLTPRARFVPIGEGPEAALSAFKARVLELITPKV